MAKSNGDAWSVPWVRPFGGNTQPMVLAILLEALTVPLAFRYDSMTSAFTVPVRPTGIHFDMSAFRTASLYGGVVAG